MSMHIIDPVVFAEGLLRSCNGNVGKALTLINKTQESLLKGIQRTKTERVRRQLRQAHDDYQDAKHILMALVGDHGRIAQILLAKNPAR